MLFFLLHLVKMKTQVNLSGVAETLLIPLYVKYKATKENKLNDPKAVEICESIDYDFDKFKNSSLTYHGVIARTIILDRELKKYLETNPNAIVVSIGCGLDTRFSRVDNGTIDWYDLDVPEAIECRNQFFHDENPRVHTIAKSAWDFSWFDDINIGNNRPILFLVEGVLMYFSHNEVQELLKRTTEKFPGCTWLVEVMSSFSASHSEMHDSVGKVGQKFKWGVKRGEDIVEMCPSLKMKGYWNLSDEFPFLLSIITRFFNDRIGLYHNE